jgi:hypothetical protein
LLLLRPFFSSSGLFYFVSFRDATGNDDCVCVDIAQVSRACSSFKLAS